MSTSAWPGVCFYTLDAEDRIVDFGGPGWNAFAEANGGPELGRAGLKGASIYAQVAGHFTRRFLREFFVAGRAAKTPLTRVYRCDAPKLKRWMEMRACAEQDGRLRIEHRLVEASPMSVEVAPTQLPTGGRPDYSRCSICNRLRRFGAQDWREPDEAGAVGLQRVVHTVCKPCRGGISSHPPLRPVSVC